VYSTGILYPFLSVNILLISKNELLRNLGE
jgi:hypothetical protein